MNKLKEINGKFYQEVDVVMLATEKATWPNCIWLGRISNQLRLDTSYNHTPKYISPIDNSMLPQHLYFLSNEEIKDDDWCIFMYDLVPKYGVCKGRNIQDKSLAKKIVATTDTSLGLPQPSQSFIQAYIKAYNESKPITKVLVEYETKLEWCYSHSGNKIQESSNPFLKINSSNEITIKKIKDSWSREEVIEKLNTAFTGIGSKNNCIEATMSTNGILTIFNLNNWIEENL